MLKITRTSLLTGHHHSRDIDVTQEQLDAWQNGELIQRAMPNVSAADREYIKTGITAEEWEETFGAAQ